MRIGNMIKQENTTEENPNSSYKILAVDDEIGIVDSLSIFLKRSGYQFVGITDPVEAIERVKQEHFDLLVLCMMFINFIFFISYYYFDYAKIKQPFFENDIIEVTEYIEDKKPEQSQLNFDMLNKESLKQVDDKMVIIKNFLDNVEGK